jgi:hypothetical protein
VTKLGISAELLPKSPQTIASSYLTLYQFDLAGNLNWTFILENEYEIDPSPATNPSNLLLSPTDEVIVLGNYATDVSSDERGFIRWISPIVVDTDDLVIGDYQVFPNPAESFLQIDGDIPLEHVTIVDGNGKVVKSIDLVGERIAVGDLPAGAYFLLLRKEKGTQVCKMIKL